ncbi:uncharacterized protein LOC120526420 isoform X2 [Polypterus senegalus]|uniref:uncharacterized protein LOC120526420 isoform X2 n=1 Tax=Polypterus senegalus TaxID=55291 RepID=UPI00196369C5|nr:uncharacterized protein LOC120526420 isoform X2 [Polypterus senegalus]XP_039605526.1 uncharacterized protein LOC120526420 isoform X2 [Polypterus senegalus]XP_039605527.1 uncharacterized protein LOC120526420 isoform X2 [Polypterus senegalus]
MNSNDCGIFMLMNDMPALRTWWCIMLPENSSPKGKYSHWTELANVLLNDDQEQKKKREGLDYTEPLMNKQKMEEASASLLQHLAQGTNEQHLLEAEKWCTENNSVFKGQVSLPSLLSMEKDDIEETLQKFDLLTEFPEEEEREYVLEPFTFLVSEMEDMHLFLENMRGKRKKTAFCKKM